MARKMKGLHKYRNFCCAGPDICRGVIVDSQSYPPLSGSPKPVQNAETIEASLKLVLAILHLILAILQNEMY